MKKECNNIEAFFALLRAGLWEKEVQLIPYGVIDFSAVQQLAEEQSIVGLIAAGAEHVSDTKIPRQNLLQFIGLTLQLEERNKSMNEFIGDLIGKMRSQGIYTLLVKGQGVAQCYERPLWRAGGDVDLFLSDSNYIQAIQFLTPLASSVADEKEYGKHIGMSIDQWTVELHGRLSCGLSLRMDKELDNIQHSVFYGGNVRSWMNGCTEVFIPRCDEDVLFVFTHFLKHFYKGGGVGLRQICDWCRLLWVYRNEIDKSLLEKRLKKLGLMSEWEAFASFAIEYLGMPKEAMSYYRDTARNRKKANRICRIILSAGNMGQKLNNSYRQNHSVLMSDVITFFRRLREFARLSLLFPCNAPKFFVTYIYTRVVAIFK